MSSINTKSPTYVKNREMIVQCAEATGFGVITTKDPTRIVLRKAENGFTNELYLKQLDRVAYSSSTLFQVADDQIDSLNELIRGLQLLDFHYDIYPGMDGEVNNFSVVFPIRKLDDPVEFIKSLGSINQKIYELKHRMSDRLVFTLSEWFWQQNQDTA